MVNFIGIPQLHAPDMRVDFSPVSNALDEYFKKETLQRGNRSLADALQGGGQPPQAPYTNALAGPTAGLGPSQPVSYGVANGAKNAMFDMGNLSTQQPGGVDRSRFNAELADPAVRNSFMALTHAEVGNQGPEAKQAFMESVLNRAAARNQPLSSAINDPSYFPRITQQRAAQGLPESTASQYAPIYDKVSAGSNMSNYATGNASGTVGFNGGPQTAAYGGERFGIEGPDRKWASQFTGGQGQPQAQPQSQPQSGPAAPQAAQPVRTADASGGIDPRIADWLRNNPNHPAAQEILGKLLEQRIDPMQGLRVQQAQATLKGTLSEQQRQGLEFFGKAALAVDEMPNGPQKDAAWARVMQRHNQEHPGEHVTPEEMDPRIGPKLMAAQAGQLAAPPKFTTVGHDTFGNPSYGFVDDRTQKITPAQVPEQQSTAQPPSPGLSGDAFLATMPKPIADQVRALAEGRMPVPGGFALKSPYWQKMMQFVSQYDPNFDAVNYGARAATRKDFTSGKSAQNITSFNTAIGHIDSLYKAIDGLDNSDYTPVNMASNAYAGQVGGKRQDALATFETSRNAVKEELTRAFKGTGGSLTEVEGWDKLIDSAKSPSALKHAARQAIELLASRIDAVGEQYNKGMGTTIDPIKLLTPRAQAAWTKFNGHAEDKPQPAPDNGGLLNLGTGLSGQPSQKAPQIHDLGDGFTMQVH